MRVIHSEDYRSHDALTGAWVGITIDTFEVPERIDAILQSLEASSHTLTVAQEHGDEVLLRVHDAGMVDYLRTAHELWLEAGYTEDPGQSLVSGYAFPTERFLGGRPLRMPRSRAAMAGVYAMDTMTQVGPGTFRGARGAVDAAQTAADAVVDGSRAAYAACRPPGHHAGPDFFGGSCYLNNAAVAAEALRSAGVGGVAVIDIDAHHGNGTQEIFYNRSDVTYGSIHVDPGAGWFPHFVGYADERGSGAGEGANLNHPLEPGTGDGGWLAGLEHILDHAAGFEPEALVVSLGVDAAVSDPESPLLISEEGYREAGRRLGSLNLPTVLVQEGGYDLSTVGSLVAAALGGFETAMER